MLIGGIVAAVAGLISLIVGIIFNGSTDMMIKFKSLTPGTPFIVAGIIVLVAGLALAGYAFYKKNKK